MNTIIDYIIKVTIENMDIGEVSPEISDVADYVRIGKSGVEVDPAFWIGRFNKVKNQRSEK